MRFRAEGVFLLFVMVPLVHVYAALLPRLPELTHPSLMTRPA